MRSMDKSAISSAIVVAGLALTACTTSSSSPDVPTAMPSTLAATATTGSVPVARNSHAASSVEPTPVSVEPTFVDAPVDPTDRPLPTPTAAAYPPDDLPRSEGTATWAFVSTFEELVDSSDLFVVGDVIDIAPAPDLGGRLPYSQSTIRVSTVAKGRSETGGTITVYQTGGIYDRTHAIEDQQKSPGPLPPEAPEGMEPQPPASIAPFVLLELEDNPLFRVGDHVALALQWEPTVSAYLVVAGPQGRFRVDAQERVHPLAAHHPAVAPLDGISLQELVARVSAASGKASWASP
jgi:hypothetical protein